MQVPHATSAAKLVSMVKVHVDLRVVVIAPYTLPSLGDLCPISVT